MTLTHSEYRNKNQQLLSKNMTNTCILMLKVMFCRFRWWEWGSLSQPPAQSISQPKGKSIHHKQFAGQSGRSLNSSLPAPPSKLPSNLFPASVCKQSTRVALGLKLHMELYSTISLSLNRPVTAPELLQWSLTYI